MEQKKAMMYFGDTHGSDLPRLNSSLSVYLKKLCQFQFYLRVAALLDRLISDTSPKYIKSFYSSTPNKHHKAKAKQKRLQTLRTIPPF